MGKLGFKDAAARGREHRVEQHPGRQVTLEEAIHAAGRGKGGPKPGFEAETIRLSVFVPADVAAKLKTVAAGRGVSVAKLVADWAATLT